MRKESETSFMIKEDVNRLIVAAKAENWELVDKEIVPKIENNPDGDGIVRELLKYTADKDSNIRDAVATGLKAAVIRDKTVMKKAIDEMVVMATTDEEKFPAGRAALFLYSNSNNPEYELKIDEALNDFRKLVEEEGWRQELTENIPQLKLVFNS